MLGSYFCGVPERTHRFFAAPPRAYALATVAHLGMLVAVEWAGQAQGCFVSQPFVLGSAEHERAVAALPNCDASRDFVDVVVEGVRVAAWTREGDAAPAVLWRVEPPPRESEGEGEGEGEGELAFFKVIRGDGWPAARLRSLHAVYGALGAALRDAEDPPPAAIVPAALLYGAGELCVRMRWVRGRAAPVEELGADGAAVAPVAAALLWLARHGLLYTDLREPNVLVDDDTGAVALVDYDDCVFVEGDARPRSGAELCEALAAREDAPFARRAGEPGARPAVVAALRELWAPR
jgi:hypothetical protein